MRIAFFGGSFDPPHVGHVAIAEAARDALGLDLILFTPVGLQPLKAGGSSAGFKDRVAMTELAIRGRRGFEVSLADAPVMDERTGEQRANYTIDTLGRLRDELEAGAEWFLLLGADSFRTLHHWRGAAEIPFAARLIVATRPGEDLSEIGTLLPAGVALAGELVSEKPEVLGYRLRGMDGRTTEMFVLAGLEYEVSATELRRELLGGAAGDAGVVDAGVLAYIRRHGLYEAS